MLVDCAGEASPVLGKETRAGSQSLEGEGDFKGRVIIWFRWRGLMHGGGSTLQQWGRELTDGQILQRVR